MLRLCVTTTSQPMHYTLPHSMQRVVFQRALHPSRSAFGRCVTHPAIPALSRRRLHSRPLHEVRAVPPSSTGPAAPLSTVAVAHATHNSSPRNDSDDASIIYVGPLTQTFRRLKIFSLSSLALASTLSPFIFIIESSLPSTARAALAATALATSGVSTALVGWCGRPYVTTLRRLCTLPISTSTSTSTAASTPPPTAQQQQQERQDQQEQEQEQQQQTTHSHNENAPAGIELTTLTLTLSPRRTRVYDPVFLCDTPRAFARWELARRVQLPPEDATGVQPGAEETVAETLDGAGHVLGRWIVSWGENGEGSCRAEGHVET